LGACFLSFFEPFKDYERSKLYAVHCIVRYIGDTVRIGIRQTFAHFWIGIDLQFDNLLSPIQVYAVVIHFCTCWSVDYCFALFCFVPIVLVPIVLALIVLALIVLALIVLFLGFFLIGFY
jgi:hypothetical protein